MKKVFLLLLLIIGLFSLVKGEGKVSKKDSPYDLIKRQYQIELDCNIRFGVNPGVYNSWYYPNAKQVNDLWNKSKSLNPWIKDPRKIKPGTIVLWDVKDIPTYRKERMFTIIGKGDNPISQGYLILKSPFQFE